MHSEMLTNTFRADGRTATHLRPFAVEFGVLRSSDGSARFSAGDTKVMVSIQGPRPPRIARLENPDRALLEIIVQPAVGVAGPFEAGLEANLKAVLESAVALKVHPRTVITVVVQIIHDDGALMCAAVNATTLALVDAGIPMLGLASAACVSGVGERLVLDPLLSEEQIRGCMAQMVTLSTDFESPILVFQHGEVSAEGAEQIKATLIAGCKTACAFQQTALRAKVAKDVL